MSSKLIKSPLAALLIGCLGTAFSAQADIVIGVAGPFSGPNATYGDQYWRGASQAAADINAAGGIKGEKIKLVQGDDACEPKQGGRGRQPAGGSGKGLGGGRPLLLLFHHARLRGV